MSLPHDLRALARALGGEVSGGQVLAPGPNHGPKDRSMSVRLSATAPDGFICFSHARDDWTDCRDYVRERLGLERRRRDDSPLPSRPKRPPYPPDGRIADALSLWAEAVDPRRTPVEAYLGARALELDEDVAGHVIRWRPDIRAMLALFRDIRSDEPKAVSRTFLDREGRKLERKFLGPVGGCAVKLDADENVLEGLHIGEGVETCMAARQLGLRPTWALGSKGAIASFPVLSVECLTILTEPDAAREVEACAARWHAESREVFINEPSFGKDLNDALRGRE
jgi:hypothetical protein